MSVHQQLHLFVNLPPHITTGKTVRQTLETCAPLVQIPRIQLKTFRGEIALLILHGVFSFSDSASLVGWVEMLHSNDYTDIVLDLSGTDPGEGTVETLKNLKRVGVRFIH